jgi:hypothetical protein
MKKAIVQIWFVGDIGPASIEYTKTYKGKCYTAHGRFLKDANRKFPNNRKIRIESI